MYVYRSKAATHGSVIDALKKMKQLCSSRLAAKKKTFLPFFLPAERGELEQKKKNEIGSVAIKRNWQCCHQTKLAVLPSNEIGSVAVYKINTVKVTKFTDGIVFPDFRPRPVC